MELTHSGYRDGYRDGVNENPRNVDPGIVSALLTPEERGEYSAGYEIGYADGARVRDALVTGRVKQDRATSAMFIQRGD